LSAYGIKLLRPYSSVVEHFLGKEEAAGSNPAMGSILLRLFHMTNRICFFGGTGFVGRHLLSYLKNHTQKPTHITCISRSTSNSTETLGSVTIDYIKGDIFNPSSSWTEIFTQTPWTHIFYSIQFPGHPVEQPSKGYTYMEYDLGGLKQIIHLLKENIPFKDQKSSPRILYVSGAGSGQSLKKPWFVAKEQAEKLLESFTTQYGGSYLALRPSVIYGDDDVSLNKILTVTKVTNVIPLLGSKDTLIQPINVEDLARAFYEFGFDSNNISGTYDFPGPQTLSLKQVLISRAHELGILQPLTIPIPLSLVYTGSYLLKHLPTPPITPQAIDFITQTALMEPSSIFKDFISQCKVLKI
jgi:nucleoside-diphosphate-sugar epimerase